MNHPNCTQSCANIDIELRIATLGRGISFPIGAGNSGADLK